MQHPETELELSESYSQSSSTFSSKNYRTYSKKQAKNTYVCIHKIIKVIVMKMKMKTRNKSNRFDINRPRSRQGHKYSKYK